MRIEQLVDGIEGTEPHHVVRIVTNESTLVLALVHGKPRHCTGRRLQLRVSAPTGNDRPLGVEPGDRPSQLIRAVRPVRHQEQRRRGRRAAAGYHLLLLIAPYLYHVDPQTPERLELENAELRARVELAEQQIAVLRQEAIARRSEIRALAESLPAAVSRRAVITSIAADLRAQPAKAWRAVAHRRRTT